LYEDIDDAMRHFTSGMTLALRRMHAKSNETVPVTIYYAFKQSDTGATGTASSGWESFLESVIAAEFVITGTWPVRTERGVRNRAIGSNALASSIVLVCRKRDKDAQTLSRREFQRELKDQLAEALDVMIGGAEGVSPVAPVDLAQAVIGPGMAIFSKYSAVLEADGSPMTVHTALTIINKMLTEGADDFDSDTQFCLAWFDEQGWSAGDFGQADVLARAKGTSVQGVAAAGVVESGSGSVRLFKPLEYPSDWLPENDNNTPVWEALHQMIRTLQTQGESASGELLAGMPVRADQIRNLAYRLYTLCERKGWAEEAKGYNELITSWSGIEAASHEKGHLGSQVKMDI
jgi:putative DNA methylase